VDAKIQPASLSGTLKIIPSKSQAHRALICAALADKPTRIECEVTSKDIEATAACLAMLGAKILRQQGGYDVTPLKRDRRLGSYPLPCGESGSTFRFLLPLAGALRKKTSFVPEGRLPKRPLSPLYEALVQHGCTLSPQGSVPFTVAGKLTPGNYSLGAGVSSQFVSGLLFALPLLNGDSTLRLSGRVESFPYIELTLAMLETFGINIEFKDTVFTIPGRQLYHSPGTVCVEGDWSNAAFWLAANAIGGGGVSVTGLDKQSRQGDRKIVDILEQFSASGKLRGIEIDARDIPDLVPILAVVAAAAAGTTVIRGAGRLRIKESDRLAAVTDMLCGLGADVRETEDGLHIHGGKTLSGGTVSSFGDHRIAMAAAIAAVLCTEPVVIRGAEAVNKSYPGFFDGLRSLGGSAELMKGGD
jgi:3-phosphoshikimate 1-carboxyvinyltransferase